MRNSNNVKSLIKVDVIKRILLISHVVFVVINSFIPAIDFRYVIGLLLIFNIVLGFGHLKLQTRVLATFIVLIILVDSVFNHHYQELIYSFSNNSNLISLFIAIPLLGMPIFFGGYSEELERVFSKFFQSPYKMIVFSSITTHLLSLLVNVASIPIVYQLIGDKKDSIDRKLLSNAILRGFISAIYWSPNFVSLILVLQVLNIEWVDFLKYGIAMSVCSLFISNYYVLKEWFYDDKNNRVNQVIVINWKKIIELAVAFLLFILLAIMLSNFSDIPMIIAIIVSAILIPLLWATYLGKISVFFDNANNYLYKDVFKKYNEITIFGLAGALGFVLQDSTLIRYYIGIVSVYVLNISEYLFLVTIIYVIWTMAILTIHPLISLTIIINTINLSSLGIDVIVFAITLIIGLGMSLISVPFTGTALISSNIINENPMKLSFEWNKKFIVTYPFLMVAIILIFRTFF